MQQYCLFQENLSLISNWCRMPTSFVSGTGAKNPVKHPKQVLSCWMKGHRTWKLERGQPLPTKTKQKTPCVRTLQIIWSNEGLIQGQRTKNDTQGCHPYKLKVYFTIREQSKKSTLTWLLPCSEKMFPQNTHWLFSGAEPELRPPVLFQIGHECCFIAMLSRRRLRLSARWQSATLIFRSKAPASEKLGILTDLPMDRSACSLTGW